MSAENSKGVKRSKAYYRRACSVSKRMRRDTFLDVGMRGFILTCNHGEQPCVREAYCLLGEYADNLYGPENEDDGNGSSGNVSDSDDIEASLLKEVAQMKRKHVKRESRFQSINSGAKNVVFIRSKLPDPTDLVYHILTDIAATQTCKSCHIIRMLPVNETCRATMEDIQKNAPRFLRSYFTGVEPTTFAVKIKIRNNCGVKGNEIIGAIATVIMESGHKVNLNHPELAVIVEIIKNVCCLSVVKDYDKLKKYNLHEITGGRGWTKKDNKNRSAKEGESQQKSNGDESQTKSQESKNCEEISQINPETDGSNGNLGIDPVKLEADAKPVESGHDQGADSVNNEPGNEATDEVQLPCSEVAEFNE